MASVADQVWAAVCEERESAVERMASLAGGDTSAWPKGPLDTGPTPDTPSRESAYRFLDALGKWLVSGSADGLAQWAGRDGPEGALSFLVGARDAVLEAAERVGAAEWALEALDSVTGILSARLDEVVAREREGIRVMVEQLEAAHDLASPLNVVTLHGEVALVKLEGGSVDAAVDSLREVMLAAERLIDTRRALAERTPDWCHNLHRISKALGGA